MGVDYWKSDGYFTSKTDLQVKHPLSDMDLLEATHRSDEEAIITIFDLYVAPLYNYALRLTSDEKSADFAVGDTFAKFLDQLHAGKGPDTNLRSYLYQTTYHLIIDESRSNRREAPLEIADCVVVNTNFESSNIPKRIEENDDLNNVFEAMREHLTEDQRHVLILRFLEDFSLKETAEITGKEVNNIKVIQNRGIAKLRKVLGIQLEED